MGTSKRGTKVRLMVGMGAVVAASFIAGCARNVYVPVERVTRDTVCSVRERTDTLLARDSVFVGMRGDTVVREVYRWRMKSRVRVDTLYRVRVDTVPVVPELPAYTEVGQSKTSGSRWKKSLNLLLWITRAAFVVLLLCYGLRYRR